MARRKNEREVIQRVIEKNSNLNKKRIAQLSIKIDGEIDDALSTLSKSLNISKNKLIEDILLESGIVQEVDENFIEVRN